MWDKIKARFGERTTYIGLATMALGIGQLAKVSEAPAIADAIVNVGNAVTTGNADPLSLLVTGIGTLLIGMKEKGGK